MPACVHACLRPCLPASMPACVHACLRPCSADGRTGEDGVCAKQETLQSKLVLLVFWTPHCGTCKDSMPLLQQLDGMYRSKVPPQAPQGPFAHAPMHRSRGCEPTLLDIVRSRLEWCYGH
jgi:thiol-disulfide isomerase/thioredoxin